MIRISGLHSDQVQALSVRNPRADPWNIDALAEIEKEYNRKINTILQLRLHPVIMNLKNQVDHAASGIIHDLDLTYITSRGNWYFNSGKAISTNQEVSLPISAYISLICLPGFLERFKTIRFICSLKTRLLVF